MGFLDKIIQPIQTKIGQGAEAIDRVVEGGETLIQTGLSGIKSPSEADIVRREQEKSIEIVPVGAILGFAKSMQEWMARSGASVGISTYDYMTERDHSVIDISGPEFENKIARVLFGDQPLRSVERRIQDFTLTVEDYGKRFAEGEAFGGKHLSESMQRGLGGLIDENAVWIAAPGVIAGIALDFTGAGGTSKAAFKTLAKTSDVGQITKMLKTIGIADDYLPTVVPRIAAMDDAVEIEKFFNRYSDMMHGASEAKEVAIKAMNLNKVNATPTLKTYDFPVSGPAARDTRSVRDSINYVNNEAKTGLTGLSGRPFDGAVEVSPFMYKIDEGMNTITGEQFNIRQLFKKGKITETEATLQMSELNKRFVTEAKKRGIATYIDDAGIEQALINKQTGFFVRKEFMEQPIANYSLGTLRPSLNALTQDAIPVRTGKYGVVATDINNIAKEAIALSNRLKLEVGAKASRVLKDNGLGLFGRYTLKRVTKVWETVPRKDLLFKSNDEIRETYKIAAKTTDAHLNVARDWGQIMDELRGATNVVRRQMNKKPIRYIDKYAPEMRKTSAWRDFQTAFIPGGSRGALKSYRQYDHVLPDSKFNPRALERTGKMAEEIREWDAAKLMDSYIDSMAKDIYISPAMSKTMLHVKALKIRGDVPKVAKYWENYTTKALAGRTSGVERWLIEHNAKRAHFALQSLVRARALGAIVGNIAFMIFTQPGSTAFAMQHAGVRNTAEGFFKYFTSRAVRAEAAASSTARIKSARGQGGFFKGIMDDADKVVYKSPISTWNDLWAMPINAMERHLTGASYSAGIQSGKKLGIKGDSLKLYANEVAEASQSMYNRGSRATVLDDGLWRGLFPFNTFNLEASANLRQIYGTKAVPGATKAGGEVVGKAGLIGMPKDARMRFGSAVSLITGIVLFDQISRRTRGVSVFSPGSFVPFVGSFVDAGIDKTFGTEVSRFPGNAPMAGAEELNQLGQAFTEVKDMTRILSSLQYDNIGQLAQAATLYAKDGNMTQFRKQLIFWGMGMAGIGAGGEMNKIIDSFIDAERGAFDNMFEHTANAILGDWAVKSTRDYREEADRIFDEFKEQEIEKHDRTAKADLYIDMAEEFKKGGEENLAVGAWDDIVSFDELLARAIQRRHKIKETGLTKNDIKLQQLTIADGRRARAIADILSRYDTQEEASARWRDLVDKRIISPEVNKQLLEMNISR